MRVEWNERTRKILSAVLYVVGVAAVLFVAYFDRVEPGFVVDYWLVFAFGIALVVVAAMIWPSRTGHERSDDEDGEGGGGPA